MSSFGMNERRLAIAQLLDREFWELARREDKIMSDLVAEIAATLEIPERDLYRYRCGRLPLPAHLVPLLCKRFDSDELMVAIAKHDLTVPELPIEIEGPYSELVMNALGEMVRVSGIMIILSSSTGYDGVALSDLEQDIVRITDRYMTLFAWLQTEFASQRTPQVESAE